MIFSSWHIHLPEHLKNEFCGYCHYCYTFCFKIRASKLCTWGLKLVPLVPCGYLTFLKYVLYFHGIVWVKQRIKANVISYFFKRARCYFPSPVASGKSQSFHLIVPSRSAIGSSCLKSTNVKGRLYLVMVKV